MSNRTAVDRPTGTGIGDNTAGLIRRHLQFGWWCLLGFLVLGLVLESLHGFKIGWYLNVTNATRRLMLTLAHAHGTLLALVNIAFAVSLPHLRGGRAERLGLAANCLLGASLLMPIGFLLGGVAVYAGDPGLGIVLVPVGALLLFVAVFLAARSTATAKGPGLPGQPPAPPK